MSVTVVVGTQWGDEGKGKTVDVLAEQADAVVRYQGGNNAGHTLVVNGEKTVLHLIPSGALYPDLECYLARGVVVHPETFLEEIDNLQARGFSLDGRLFISQRAPVIMPWHLEIDALREGSDGSIGTTKKGIGPCYEQFVARQGILAGDLVEPDLAIEKIRLFYRERYAVISRLKDRDSTNDLDAAVERAVEKFRENHEKIYSRLVPFVADVESKIQRRLDAGDHLLFEGAQGTFLDVGMGTYPFVTSSHTTASGACTGAGIAPRDIDRVVGICKAYTTRVGDGPFPTELSEDSEAGAHLRSKGHEFGATTGRPRRCGWLDLEVLTEAIRINGCDGIVLTKLDVLSGLDEIPVALGRDDNGELVYETLPGWQEDITGARSMSDLPKAAADYVRFIDEKIKPLRSTISQVSVGPGRAQIFPLD